MAGFYKLEPKTESTKRIGATLGKKGSASPEEFGLACSGVSGCLSGDIHSVVEDEAVEQIEFHRSGRRSYIRKPVNSAQFSEAMRILRALT